MKIKTLTQIDHSYQSRNIHTNLIFFTVSIRPSVTFCVTALTVSSIISSFLSFLDPSTRSSPSSSRSFTSCLFFLCLNVLQLFPSVCLRSLLSVKVFVVQRKSQVIPVFTRLLLSVFLDSLSLYIFAIYLPDILKLRLYIFMFPVSFLSSLCIE